MKCDHVIAFIGNQPTTETTYPDALAKYQKDVDQFIEARIVAPTHPGFIKRCAFCPMCGTKIDSRVFEKESY